MIRYSSEYWKDIEAVAKVIPQIKTLFSKSILFTGGTGMICSSVIEILIYLNRKYNAGIKIYVAGRSLKRVKRRFPNEYFRNGIQYIFFDAIKGLQEKLPVFDYVIYGASPADPILFSTAPVNVILANVIGLQSILSQITTRTKVLYISSSEVYGEKDNNNPYNESDYGYVDILNVRAAYPCAKRLAENLCISYIKQYGLDIVMARPGHIYGPSITESDSRATAQFTRKAVVGKDIILKSAGLQLRSYCYTLDCASAILCILLCGKKGEAYNISNKNSVVSIRDIANAFADSVNRHIVFENPSDQEKRGFNLMLNSVLDSSKLEKMKWKPLFNLIEGVGRTIKYYDTK